VSEPALSALESCIELFRDHATPPSMDTRSICDQANRARLELRALREAAGLSKPLDGSAAFRSDRRFQAACAAMTGMLADTAVRAEPEEFAQRSVVLADALLAEMEKPQ